MSKVPKPLPKAGPRWPDDNEIYRQMQTSMMRVKDLIEGRAGKLLIIYGPPGIGKSRGVMYELARYSKLKQAEWDEAEIKPERRTTMDDMGRQAFRPPYEIISGRITHPQFHCRMYYASHVDEILFLDDVQSLTDSRIQNALQLAADPTHHGMVSYNYRADLPDPEVPKRFPMLGGIVIVTNFRKSDERRAQLFPPALLDRADEVEFTWDRSQLITYVMKMGFGKPGILMNYLRAPNKAQNPGLSESKRGAGFRGSDAEAAKILQDVSELFAANTERVEIISFRILQRLINDRVWHPDKWVELADRNHFLPHREYKQVPGGGPQHAYLERPEK